MNKHTTIFSIAAVIAASGLALQAPLAGAADDSARAADAQGVPGVEMNVGNNASDRGLPGVEANVGAQGDQNNAIGAPGDQDNIDTRTLGAGADTGLDADGSRALRADRG